MEQKPLLSVIVPVYNEAGTIQTIIERIQAVHIEKEIIIVNDGSSDATEQILKSLKDENIKQIHHSSNRGKGAAFLTGLTHATGEYVIIQDADLEYSPDDYDSLLTAIRLDNVDIVLGARFLKGYHGLLLHRWGNRFLTSLFNFLFNAHLNDYATCYKIARREVYNSLGMKACGFDIDVEFVCNALKRKKKIREVPITYNPRTYRDGKKIRWKDGVWAVFYMFKYRFR